MARTFWYELLDLKPDPERKDVERNFGLLRTDGVTKKPAGLALQHLVALLADPGATFAPGRLDYSLSDEKVRHVLLQKRNGEFWLALWLPQSLWDHSRPYGQKKEEDPAGITCKLTFATAPARLTRHTDLDRADVITSDLPPGTSVEIPVSARVTLLRIEMPRP